MGKGVPSFRPRREFHPQTIPKGYLAVMVGRDGEDQQRFWIPVAYLNHPLFRQLLKVAEDEFGFDHKGAITLPCHVADFREVQGLIDLESSFGKGGGHVPLVACFKA